MFQVWSLTACLAFDLITSFELLPYSILQIFHYFYSAAVLIFLSLKFVIEMDLLHHSLPYFIFPPFTLLKFSAIEHCRNVVCYIKSCCKFRFMSLVKTIKAIYCSRFRCDLNRDSGSVDYRSIVHGWLVKLYRDGNWKTLTQSPILWDCTYCSVVSFCSLMKKIRDCWLLMVVHLFRFICVSSMGNI